MLQLAEAPDCTSTWRVLPDRTCVELSLVGEVLRVLARESQYLPAVAHVEDLVTGSQVDHSDAVGLFNMILLGIQQSGRAEAPKRAEQILRRMIETQAKPNGETLRILVEAKTRFAGPGFLTDVGQTVLDLGRRFVGIPPDGAVLLAVSAAQLRAGDLEAAYRWFVASQLEESRQSLDSKTGSSMELVSQLLRGLAVGGQARQLLRILQKVKEDGGKLPVSASSLAIAGYTSGRSLATCWMEPPADVVRRRGIWASEDNVRVRCAEQWNWKQLDAARHEVHQWHPYLPPDAKIERAWLAPLRALDTNALGLVRDWCGETPAQATARERLGERGNVAVDMRSALCVEPPGARTPSSSSSFFSLTQRSKSRPVALTPEPRTWRSFHADMVKRSYGNSNRFRAPCPEQLRSLGKSFPAQGQGRSRTLWRFFFSAVGACSPEAS